MRRNTQEYLEAVEAENATLRATVALYRAALELIAHADYRGNRSPESTVAFHVLHPPTKSET